ncbi:MAG: hypothetical protein CSB21_03815 [Deltaproteobacteria bacterium]|nr:MAG: hypothetical protein CSB21_03815 [Deltaproteobacteria bacterium]
MQEKNDFVELPEIDNFTLFVGKSARYINEHKKYFIFGAFIFISALILASYIPFYMSKQRAKSFAVLQSGIDLTAGMDNVTLDAVNKAFGPVFKDYKNSEAYGYACLYAGRTMYRGGEKDNAEVFYKKALKSFGNNSLPGELSQYGEACSYFDREPELSFASFSQLIKKDSFLKEDALFYKGLAGDTSSLEILIKEYPDGFYSDIAQEIYLSRK